MLNIEITANSQTKNILENLDDSIVVNINSLSENNTIGINSILQENEPLKLYNVYQQYENQPITSISVKNGDTVLLQLESLKMSWSMSYSMDRLNEQIMISKEF